MPPPAPVPVPPAPGKATYKLHSGLATSKMHYFAPQQEVVVRGRVKVAVKGEVLTLYAIRGHKASKSVRRRVKSGGRFEFRFKVGGPGQLRLVIKHKATALQQAFRTRDNVITVVDWQAGAGERGVKVLLLQRALLARHFATPVTGYFDDATARAVLAFRKTNDMSRDGFATHEVYAKLLRGQGAFKLRYPKAGKHVEFDWSRQVLVLAQNGKPYRTYHASSGKPSTPTVFGTFHFYLADARDEREGHGRLVVLHRRLRHPRLRRRARLRGEPRLRASADPERAPDLQLDRHRRPDLRLRLAPARSRRCASRRRASAPWGAGWRAGRARSRRSAGPAGPGCRG